MHQAGVVATI